MRNHQTRNRDLWQVWLADQSRWVDLADQEALTCHFRVMHRDDGDAPFQTGGRFVKRHVPRKLDSECPPIPCPKCKLPQGGFKQFKCQMCNNERGLGQSLPGFFYQQRARYPFPGTVFRPVAFPDRYQKYLEKRFTEQKRIGRGGYKYASEWLYVPN